MTPPETIPELLERVSHREYASQQDCFLIESPEWSRISSALRAAIKWLEAYDRHVGCALPGKLTVEECDERLETYRIAREAFRKSIGAPDAR